MTTPGGVCSRRDVLKAGALAAAAPQLLAAEKPASPVVDTHTHFYDPTRPQGVPWPGKGDAFLYRPVLPEEFQRLTRDWGVVGTVVVEASAWLEDNQWVLDLADRNPFLLGLVGHLEPGTADFRGHLARFAKHPKFLGIRVNSGPLGPGLEQPEFVADLQRLMEAGRELDVNGRPDLLPLVDRLARRLPELRIVINHLANVRIDGPRLDAEWLAGLKAAARHPRVYCKVSALVEGAAQGDRQAPSDPAYYRPVLDAVWEAFGDDRVVYGSNWPVSARYGDYAVVQTIVAEYVRDKGVAATEKFFFKNAAAAYRWPKSAG